jgi:ribonuclease HI
LYKGYNQTWRTLILQQIPEWGLEGSLPLFVVNFLKSREIRVRCGHILSQSVPLENGIQQGSPLSGTLFNIAMHSLMTILPPKIYPCLFVDDIAIFLRGPHLSMLQQELQTALASLEIWSQQTGFTFSEAKTKVMHFCKKRKCQTQPVLFLNNNQLRVVPTHRFLGMIFDSKLTWAPHLQSLKHRATKDLNLLKTLHNYSWGADTTSLLHIYRAIVRSKIDYGSIVYSSATTSLLQNIETIQNTALRLSLGAFRSSPVVSMQIEAREPPLQLRRKLLSFKYVNKVRDKPGHSAYLCVTTCPNKQLYEQKSRSSKPLSYRTALFMNEMSDKVPTMFPLSVVQAFTPPWCIPRRINLELSTLYAKKDCPPTILVKAANRLINRYPCSDYKHFYTDGSKTPMRVSAAFIENETTHGFPLMSQCSIFTAELFAIWQCLIFIDSLKVEKSVIFTDSLSVATALNNLWPTTATFLPIYELLYTNHVHIAWIPSHIGIPGNESADQAAKLAATNFCGPAYPTLTSLDCETIFRQHVVQQWQEIWNQQAHNNKLFLIQPLLHRNHILPDTRKNETAVTRLRIGHTWITHNHLMNKSPPPSCPSCTCQLTVYHILFTCPKYQAARNRLNIPSDPAKFLKEDNRKQIIEYLKTIDLLKVI